MIIKELKIFISVLNWGRIGDWTMLIYISSISNNYTYFFQVVQDGYEFFANRKLVTLFSAPHYCGEFDNAAAVMLVAKDLQCCFKILRPKWPVTKVKTQEG